MRRPVDQASAVRPLLPAGCFGGGLPTQDMRVSLQHAFLAWDGRPGGKGEVLIRARHIAEELGRGRLLSGPMASVVYFHLTLDQHHLILADGVWTESVFAGPQALRSDPLLRRMVRDAALPPCGTRARKLLLRKHLQRFKGHALGTGAPSRCAAA